MQRRDGMHRRDGIVKLRLGFLILASVLFIVSAAPIGMGLKIPVSALETPTVKLALVASLIKPVDIAARANDSGIYVAQQSGQVVRLGRNGVKTVALDLSKLTNAKGERGLLGLVFHPNGKSLFVNYTDVGGNTVVARYVMKQNGTAESNSQVVLFRMKQPYANHNGGGLAFGPNGRLFVGTGDGGSSGDPQRAALDFKSRLGKILSLNANATSQASNDLVIWSRGLRNPWRFEFDAQGNLWIADVGQDKLEEVNLVLASDGSGEGKSFGWSAYEADSRYNADQPATGHLFPVHSYKHGDAGCSISGGTRIRDTSLVLLKDWYVYGDYCSKNLYAIWVVGTKTTQTVALAKNVGSITAVRTVYGGAAYVLTMQGKIYQIVK